MKLNLIWIRYKWIVRDAILYKVWTGWRRWLGSFSLAAVVEKCRGSRKNLGPVLVCEVLGRFEEPRGAGINFHERLRRGTSSFRLLHCAVSVVVRWEVMGHTAAVTCPRSPGLEYVLNLREGMSDGGGRMLTLYLRLVGRKWRHPQVCCPHWAEMSSLCSTIWACAWHSILSKQVWCSMR